MTRTAGPASRQPGRRFTQAALATSIPSAEKPVIPATRPLAFTLAPHLQIINYQDCFSPFVGI
ncbi:MAG: hypothetical protein WAV72_12365 [Bradyrhizobium sp.]